MKYLQTLLVVVTICSPLPSFASAKPYAEHNATRNVEDTLRNISDRGNWKSFMSAIMLNHDFANEDEAIIAIRDRGRIGICPANGRIQTAGVVSDSVGEYAWRDCKPGEYLLFLDEVSFSLYCGNPIIATENVPIPPPLVAEEATVEEPTSRRITENCLVRQRNETVADHSIVASYSGSGVHRSGHFFSFWNHFTSYNRIPTIITSGGSRMDCTTTISQ